mmetsp:Transcript_33475/g.73240  ORF Transcript_33475/g.73240 Transcript_33475/m.73240 type:complete len:255 (-) Transcript_33475:7-771(-)
MRASIDPASSPWFSPDRLSCGSTDLDCGEKLNDWPESTLGEEPPRAPAAAATCAAQSSAESGSDSASATGSLHSASRTQRLRLSTSWPDFEALSPWLFLEGSSFSSPKGPKSSLACLGTFSSEESAESLDHFRRFAACRSSFALKMFDTSSLLSTSPSRFQRRPPLRSCFSRCDVNRWMRRCSLLCSRRRSSCSCSNSRSSRPMSPQERCNLRHVSTSCSVVIEFRTPASSMPTENAIACGIPDRARQCSKTKA